MISDFEIQILERELEEAQKRAQQEAEVEKTRTEEENAALREAVRIEAEAKATAEQEAEAQKQRAAKASKEAEKRRIVLLAETNPRIQAVITGELRFYFADLPSYIASGVADAVEDIAEVLLDWRPYSDVSLKRVYSESDADLVVAWIKDYGSHTLGQSIFKSHIKVGLGATNCHGDRRAFDANTVKKVLWHEIGHSIGYGHSSNPNNVMYSTTDTQFEVEQDIGDVIPGGWWMTFPLCSSGNYRYFFSQTTITLGSMYMCFGQESLEESSKQVMVVITRVVRRSTWLELRTPVTFCSEPVFI